MNEHEHVGYVCPGTNSDCKRGDCSFCDRELFACIHCFGLDQGGSLTTDCPLRPLSAKETNDVQDGKLDYRRIDSLRYDWVKKSSPHAREKIG